MQGRAIASGTRLLIGLVVAGNVWAQSGGQGESERISAFPCVVCPGGGKVLGILPGGHGRAVRSFGAFKEFCVSEYRYEKGELHVRFKLEGELWPEGEDWALQADSWQATCREMQWGTKANG